MSHLTLISGNGKREQIPFINQQIELRKGMKFHYWSDKANSLSSPELRYAWGITIDGRWVWRNYVSLPNLPENNIDADGLKAQAIADARGFLSATSDRLASFL